jgi:hypothetical protein
MARLFLVLISPALLAACGGGSGNNSANPDGAPAADGGSNPDGVSLPRPIAIGSGYNVGVTVDPAGTAYIAWVGPESTVTSLQFCRLPRGGTACDAKGVIATEGTSLSRPFVVVDGMIVQVVSYRYGLTGGAFAAVFLFTSNDGGRTFDSGRRVGTAPFSAAALGPGRAVSLVTHAYHNGMVYQAVPLEPGAAAAATEAVLSTTHPYSGAVGLDGTTPVVAFASGSGDAQLRSYLGTGDQNTADSWSPPRDIGKGDRMHLAGGSKGLFLLAQGAAGLEVRRYGAGVFGSAVQIPNGTGELAHAHMVQDATGRLHVLWPRIEADGIYLNHAVSDTGTVWQTGLVTVDDGFEGVRMALAPDQVGIAVWGTSAASASSSSIHAVAVRASP